MSVIYSFYLLALESTKIVALLLGNMYKSGEIVTGLNVFGTVFGKVSETIVNIIDVLPTPSSPKNNTLISLLSD